MLRFAMEKLQAWKEKKRPKASDYYGSQTGRKNLADEGVRHNLLREGGVYFFL